MSKFEITPQGSVQTIVDFAAAFRNATNDADSLIVGSGAYLRADGQGAAGAILDNVLPWTVQVEGSIYSRRFNGLELQAGNEDVSRIAVGGNGEIVGGYNGILAQSAVAITNRGVIEGTAGDAVAVDNAGNNRLNNLGSISGEIAFRSFGAASDDRVRNAGDMTGSLIFGGGDDRLDNSGRIAGDLSKHVVNLGAGDDTLINSGTIAFQVVDVDGSDTVENSGLIGGDVFLGAGDDVFVNFIKTKAAGKANGSVAGEIDLGDGDDRLKGSADAETYRDGSGADIANLGGGDDIYRAVGLVSIDGIDRINGGKGIDLYDALTAVDSVFINLDSVSHGLPFGSGFAEIEAGTALGATVGGAKSDRIKGFENVYGGIESDVIYGSAQNNYIFGAADMDDLHGLGGDDHIVGGDGLDFLTGGEGKDTLTGSEGYDVFVFTALRDSGTTAAGGDVITDFEVNVDTIDLSLIDAIKGTATNDAFAFIGTNASFTGEAGELRATRTTNGLVIEADVDGDAVADFSLVIADGNVAIQATDFEL